MPQELRRRISAAIYGKGIVPYYPSSTRVLIVAQMGTHTHTPQLNKVYAGSRVQGVAHAGPCCDTTLAWDVAGGF